MVNEESCRIQLSYTRTNPVGLQDTAFAVARRAMIAGFAFIGCSTPAGTGSSRCLVMF